MSDELNDNDPFADAEPASEADYISEGMVRKATYLIHKLADRKGQDYKEIQKKCKKLFAYTNLAKVPLEDGHAIINKLIELTGGEEEKHQLPAKSGEKLKATVKDNLTHEKTVQESAERVETKELETELRKLAGMLEICVGFSRDIVQTAVGRDNVTEGTQAMLVKSFAATIFIEASRRGLGR